jgi:hypothetical protein
LLVFSVQISRLEEGAKGIANHSGKAKLVITSASRTDRYLMLHLVR